MAVGWLNNMEKITSQTALDSQYVTALWAVDPSEYGLLPGVEVVTEIRSLLGGGFLGVHPVYVCSEEGAGAQKAKDKIQAQVRGYLNTLDLGPMAEVEVVYSPSNKRSDWVDGILHIAQDQKAEVILLTSHGRSTLGVFFLGSFANELLQKSTTPLLFISPRRAKEAQLEKVLFATDFSEESKVAFQKFLRLVKGKVSDLILFHSVYYPILSMSAAQAGGLFTPMPDSFMEDQKEWVEREIEVWLKEAQKSDVKIHFHSLVEDSLTSAAAAIEKVAERERVGLIGLVSHVGPVAKLALGSVTQDLLPSHKFNLWVCGPTKAS
jgi:nucleotide-binding universal stress UspA family protein